MVARLVRDQEVACSSHVTSTTSGVYEHSEKEIAFAVSFFSLFLLSICAKSVAEILSRNEQSRTVAEDHGRNAFAQMGKSGRDRRMNLFRNGLQPFYARAGYLTDNGKQSEMTLYLYVESE